MPLEAVMLIVDNSESSRNGDYTPNRYEAQVDAANIIFQHITNGNPESSVGLMSMAGQKPDVLCTLTTEQGKVLGGLDRTRRNISGSSQLSTATQIASLALKHRQNKSQRQRIIVFVCSPVKDDEKELVKLAKKMKKGTIDVDFVLFGELDDDSVEKKLQAFNDAVKSGENSHLVTIPPSGQLLSDQLISSPIMLGEGAANGSGSGAADGESGGGFDGFDFDPNQDPELALALRMSMEEENARQARAAEQDTESKPNLEGIKEEDEAAQPLLNEQGEASGSSFSKKDDKKGDDDKMDTS